MSAGPRSSTWACGGRRPTSRSRLGAISTTHAPQWRLRLSDAGAFWLPPSGGASAGRVCPSLRTGRFAEPSSPPHALLHALDRAEAYVTAMAELGLPKSVHVGP